MPPVYFPLSRSPIPPRAHKAREDEPLVGQAADAFIAKPASVGELAAKYRRIVGHPLEEKARAALSKVGPQGLRQWEATLNAIAEVKAKRLSPSGYMIRVMDSAAKISGNDTQVFLQLVHMSFSSPSEKLSWVERALRWFSGGGPDAAGSVLERAYQKAAGDKNTVHAGFNPNVVDRSPKSTVTHHFGEFLEVGANRPWFFAQLTARTYDDPDKNPGDVRNGLFAAMLGGALDNNKISPKTAVALTRWAYLKRDGIKPPPWGFNETFDYVHAGKYKLQAWLDAR